MLLKNTIFIFAAAAIVSASPIPDHGGVKARGLPDTAFVPNAYQQATGIDSAQFGMFTTGP
ncbi:hypothetical protein GGI12_002125, partial [Dipsacomyces acuminosporus]